MKKTGNLCIFALCAIFIGVALGCSGASGGSNGEDGDNQGTKPPVIPIDPTKPTEPVIPTDPDDGKEDNKDEQKYPAYYINEEFAGQRFVEVGTDWYYQTDRDTKFATCYDNAKKFLKDKIDELKNDLAGQPNNQYSEMIRTALDDYNANKNQNNIGNNINSNYDALVSFFATLAPYNPDVDPKYYQVMASYHKLAHNAYNNSLGAYKGTYSAGEGIFNANRQMDLSVDGYSVYREELEYAGYTSDIGDADAQKNMNTYLQSMASRTNISQDVLKKVVELALYNESLYGLNDLAKLYRVAASEIPLREYSIFDMAIRDARNNTKAQNIDDRML